MTYFDIFFLWLRLTNEQKNGDEREEQSEREIEEQTIIVLSITNRIDIIRK